MTQSDETHGDWAGPLPDRCRGLVSRSKRDRDIGPVLLDSLKNKLSLSNLKNKVLLNFFRLLN